MPGVYISYPFCAQKCTYCNFASGVFSRDLEREYLAALRNEIVSTHFPWTPETVYLGGGTPSRMGPDDLAQILGSIPGCPWREATLEVAPGGLTRDLAEAWRRAGINRVSLGVQSFIPRELARTGRKHNAEIVASEIATLRAAGITNINIDLIAGLPGQTLTSWRESLSWIEKLGPPHVSVYMLEIDPDSRLGNEVLLNGKRYGAREIPADDLIAELYETAVDELACLEIHRYEISNFARPGFESAHNLKYWRLDPYLGFGADAHSFDGVNRWQNVETAAEYVAGCPKLSSTHANRGEEHFFVGLRLMDGIRPQPEEWVRFQGPISHFLSEGLLARDGDKLRLTSRGVLLSNEIFAEFITT